MNSALTVVDAFPAHSGTTPADRCARMFKLASPLEADLESFAALEALDTGKWPSLY